MHRIDKDFRDLYPYTIERFGVKTHIGVVIGPWHTCEVDTITLQWRKIARMRDVRFIQKFPTYTKIRRIHMVFDPLQTTSDIIKQCQDNILYRESK
jgi:hypothetical protein